VPADKNISPSVKIADVGGATENSSVTPVVGGSPPTAKPAVDVPLPPN
jgi:hypothetical protein